MLMFLCTRPVCFAHLSKIRHSSALTGFHLQRQKNIPGTLKASVEVEILPDITQGGKCTESFIVIDTLAETLYAKMFHIFSNYMRHLPLPIIPYVYSSHTISLRIITQW